MSLFKSLNVQRKLSYLESAKKVIIPVEFGIFLCVRGEGTLKNEIKCESHDRDASNTGGKSSQLLTSAT